jgi:hypothetical protein
MRQVKHNRLVQKDGSGFKRKKSTQEKTMKNLTKTILTTLATGFISCALFSQQAQAVTMTGGISFAGGYTPQDGSGTQPDLTLATQISFGPTFVFSTSGSFTSVLTFSAVTMNSPLVFSPPTPLSPLWTVGGFTFNLLTLTQQAGTTPSSLTLTGTGTIVGNSFDPTSGNWIATFNSGGGTFSWSSSTSSVPDGGSAVALLGIALAGVEVLRRKFKAA